MVPPGLPGLGDVVVFFLVGSGDVLVRQHLDDAQNNHRPGIRAKPVNVPPQGIPIQVRCGVESRRHVQHIAREQLGLDQLKEL